MAFLYRKVAFGIAAGPVPAAGWHGLSFHAMFIGFALLYYLLFEGLAGTTFGKLCCGLRIIRADGHRVGIIAALLRNILRPLDYLLAGLIVGILVMEKRQWHQRLGDIVARTLVMRVGRGAEPRVRLSIDVIASASGRMFAGVVDFLFYGIFLAGYLLLFDSRAPLTSMFLLLLFPFIAILLVAGVETCARTSPGKWLLGYITSH